MKSIIVGGATGAASAAMARMTTPNEKAETDLSRAESARRVLEARRQKQKNEPTQPAPAGSSTGEATTPTTPPSAGVTQVLGGRLLQGLHDILMLMDEKVEHLITDVNNMRAELQGHHLDGSSERTLHEIQAKVDLGFATMVSQLKHLHAVPRSDIPSADSEAHVPISQPANLMRPFTDAGDAHHEGRQKRTSSSDASSSLPARSDLHEMWEEMEQMGTDELIACGDTMQEPTFGSGQEDFLESKATHLRARTIPEREEKMMTAEEAMQNMHSRKSSARNSGISTSKSPRRSLNSFQARSSRASREKVQFSSEERPKINLKNLQNSKSIVDDKFKDFVKPRQRSSVQKLVWNFLEDPDLVRGGRTYGNFLSFTIFISAILPIVPTDGAVEGNTWLGHAILYGLLIIDCLFFIEVLVRLYGAPNRLRFFISIHNWLDILSVILPTSLKIHLQSLNLAADAHMDIVGIELGLLVMVPVLRLLKLLRRFENSHLIKQAFREAIGALPSLLYCMMVLVVGFSAIIYAMEPRGNVETMPRAIWFTMVTLTTVGYGDVVPVSPGGNIVVCVLMIVSAMYMAMPLGIVGKAFGSVWDDRHRLLLMERLRTRFSTVGYDPQDIPGLFCSYDENGDGELSMEEFRQMLQQLEVEAKDERAHDVFAAFDNDGSGAIDDSEFIKTLFPTAYKSMYKEPQSKIEEEPEKEHLDL